MEVGAVEDRGFSIGREVVRIFESIGDRIGREGRGGVVKIV